MAQIYAMVELMESTVKELKDFNEGLQGTLAIGTISSSGGILLPERICSFNKKYPNINFEIRQGSTNEILELLKSGLIEIGVIRTPLNSEIYESINLPSEPMVAAISDSTSWENNEPSLNTNTTIVWMKDQYLSSVAKHFLQTFEI